MQQPWCPVRCYFASRAGVAEIGSDRVNSDLRRATLADVTMADRQEILLYVPSPAGEVYLRNTMVS